MKFLCVLFLTLSAAANAATVEFTLPAEKPDRTLVNEKGEVVEVYGDIAVMRSHRLKSAGSLTSLSWTLGLVRYCAAGLDAGKRAVIEEAALMWNDSSAARIFEDCASTPRINFVNVPFAPSEPCGLSFVGMVAQPGETQSIWIREDCWTGRVVGHELGHALGFFHEHQRSDRGNFVAISGPNCSTTDYGLRSSANYTAYDFASIMHYGAGNAQSCFIQALNAQPAGEPLGSEGFCTTAAQCQALMGQPVVSPRDALGVMKRYGFRVPIVRRGPAISLSVSGALVDCNSASECLFDFGATASFSVNSPTGFMTRFSGACQGTGQCTFDPTSNRPVFITTYSRAEGGTGLDLGVMRDSFEGPASSVF